MILFFANSPRSGEEITKSGHSVTQGRFQPRSDVPRGQVCSVTRSSILNETNWSLVVTSGHTVLVIQAARSAPARGDRMETRIGEIGES